MFKAGKGTPHRCSDLRASWGGRGREEVARVGACMCLARLSLGTREQQHGQPAWAAWRLKRKHAVATPRRAATSCIACHLSLAIAGDLLVRGCAYVSTRPNVD